MKPSCLKCRKKPSMERGSLCYDCFIDEVYSQLELDFTESEPEEETHSPE